MMITISLLRSEDIKKDMFMEIYENVTCCRVHTTLRSMLFASVTQLVEWSSPKAQVGGSSPSWRAIELFVFISFKSLISTYRIKVVSRSKKARFVCLDGCENTLGYTLAAECVTKILYK